MPNACDHGDKAGPPMPAPARGGPHEGSTAPTQVSSVSHDANPDIEPLLLEVLRRGFMLICCGRRAQPDALAAVHRTE